MSFVEWLAQPASRMLTLTLVHFLWQGLLIALSLTLLVRLCGIRRPSSRYACSLAALFAIAAFPVATLILISLTRDAAQFSPLFESVGLSKPTSILSSPVDTSLVPVDPHLFDRMQPFVLAAWLGGVMFFGSRLLAGAIGTCQLRRSRLPLPRELAASVERLGSRLRMDALPLVFLSKQVTDAMALGLVRRFVLVPAAWATEMPLDMLEAVIAHELAHLRRMDLWANFLQRIVETLFFYHPAVWWLSRRLAIERELCTDELAVAATGERLIYAQTLEHIAGQRPADIRPALAAFLQGENEMRLLQRIRNVLTPTSNQVRHWPAGLMAVGLAICLWTLSLTLLDTLTSPAHADEPAQNEAGDDEATDKESIDVELSFENENQNEEAADDELAAEHQIDVDLQEVIKGKVAEALQKALLEVESVKNTKLAKPSPKIEFKFDQPSPKIEFKLDKVHAVQEQISEGRKKARALQQQLLEKDRRRNKQLLAERETALQQVAEKFKQAQLRGDQAEAETLEKSLQQHAEQLAQAARAHAEQLVVEAQENAMREHTTAVEMGLKGQQIPAEALKALHQHFEELGKARREDEQRQAEALKSLHHHIAALENGRREGERHHAEALMALHQHMVEFAKSREQQGLEKAQMEDVLRKSALVDGVALQRANDERIEKLSAMVTELAGQVERLQKELHALRGETEAKTRALK
jgi:beta-lactamase regulating signal transducer with metallopeptidase domain